MNKEKNGGIMRRCREISGNAAKNLVDKIDKVIPQEFKDKIGNWGEKNQYIIGGGAITLVFALILVCVLCVSGGNADEVEPTPAVPTPVVDTTPAPEPEEVIVEQAATFTTEYGVFNIVEDTVKVTMDSFIRREPWTNGERLAGVKTGTQLQRIGMSDNNWSVVIYEDIQGYLPTYYLEALDMTDYGYMHETVTAIERVNVRASASTEGTVLGTLDMGEEIIRTGEGDNGWSKVLYKGNEAYVCSEYIVKVNSGTSTNTTASSNNTQTTPSTQPSNNFTPSPDAEYTIVNQLVQAKSNVNVRRGPSTDAEIMGTLLGGKIVNRVSVGEDGWSKVEFNGGVGYVKSDYLTGVVY